MSEAEGQKSPAGGFCTILNSDLIFCTICANIAISHLRKSPKNGHFSTMVHYIILLHKDVVVKHFAAISLFFCNF